MAKANINLVLAFVGIIASTSSAYAIDYSDLLGSWVAEDTNETIEFRPGNDVIDFRYGQGRFSNQVISNAANMAVVYQGNKWCYYYARVTGNKQTLFLARRNERQDPWVCTEGRFTAVR